MKRGVDSHVRMQGIAAGWLAAFMFGILYIATASTFFRP